MPQALAGLHDAVEGEREVDDALPVAGGEVAVRPQPGAGVLSGHLPELDVPSLASRVAAASRCSQTSRAQ